VRAAGTRRPGSVGGGSAGVQSSSCHGSAAHLSGASCACIVGIIPASAQVEERMSADRDLRTELVAALKVLEGFQVSTEPSIEEVEDPESEPLISGDPVKLYLAASHDRDIEMTVERVLAIVAELQEGSLVETEMLVGGNWAIVRVVGGNDRAEHFCRTVNYHDVEDRFFECKHEDVHLYLQGGVNALPFHYSKLGIAEEIFSEFGNDELYVFCDAHLGSCR